MSDKIENLIRQLKDVVYDCLDAGIEEYEIHNAVDDAFALFNDDHPAPEES